MANQTRIVCNNNNTNKITVENQIKRKPLKNNINSHTVKNKVNKMLAPTIRGVSKPLHLTKQQFVDLMYKRTPVIPDLQQGKLSTSSKQSLRTLSHQDLITKMIELRYHYNLTQQNMANLLKISQATYAAMELGKRHLSLDFINQLSAIYGFEGWLFIREHTPFLAVNQLPKPTRKEVETRAKGGKRPRYSITQLQSSLTILLRSGRLPAKFTATNIYQLLEPETRLKCSLRHVNEYFRLPQIKKLVVEAGRKTNGHKLYKLIKSA